MNRNLELMTIKNIRGKTTFAKMLSEEHALIGRKAVALGL